MRRNQPTKKDIEARPVPANVDEMRAKTETYTGVKGGGCNADGNVWRTRSTKKGNEGGQILRTRTSQ